MIKKLLHKLISTFRQINAEIVKTELRIQEIQTISKDCKLAGVTSEQFIDTPLVVSLTTYKDRIYDVHLTIESIMQQSLLPNRIILWLDKDEYSDSSIPLILKNQKLRGLEIKYCENLKSYKKIIPTLKESIRQTIITVDDDVIYPHDFIERFISAYKKDKNCIYFTRGRYIGRKEAKVLSYDKWKLVNDTEKRLDIIPTGIGGILYPAGCFHEDVAKEDIFMKLCPKADDIWLRAMTLLNDYPCAKIKYSGSFRYSFVNLDDNQDIALSNTNLFENTNDSQFIDVFNKYNLLDKINNI